VSRSVRESEAPLIDYQPALHARISETVRAAGASVILNGTWADQVLYPFPPGYLLDALHSGQWARLWSHVRGLPGWFEDVPRAELWRAIAGHVLRAHVPGGLPPLVQRWRRPGGIARVLAEQLLASIRVPAAPIVPWSEHRSAHARAVERQVRARLDTLTLEWFAKSAARQGIQAALPYLDRELLTLLISAPGLAQTNGGTPKSLLRAGMKELVPAEILERRNKGDYTTLTMAVLRSGAERVFEELRDGRVRSCGLLDARALKGDLALFSRQAHIGESETALALASLYAVECWLREFCDT
jgi:hypothetical protein